MPFNKLRTQKEIMFYMVLRLCYMVFKNTKKLLVYSSRLSENMGYLVKLEIPMTCTKILFGLHGKLSCF